MTNYEKIDNRFSYTKQRKLINGRTTGCNKCVGYCNYCNHRGFLNIELQAEHNCIEKQCFHYIPKERTKPKNNAKKDISNEILILANELIKDMDGVKLIRANSKNINSYEIYYITLTNDYSFSKCVDILNETQKIKAEFLRLNYDFDTCVKLFMAS